MSSRFWPDLVVTSEIKASQQCEILHTRPMLTVDPKRSLGSALWLGFQRLAVRGKMSAHFSLRLRKSVYAPIDTGDEMVARISPSTRQRFCFSGFHLTRQLTR